MGEYSRYQHNPGFAKYCDQAGSIYGALKMTLIVIFVSKLCYIQPWITKVNALTLYEFMTGIQNINLSGICYYVINFISAQVLAVAIGLYYI